ncbi:MAG: hypothetical protein J6D47_05960 [Peptostreptococcaceae bacterium]|nr:hypothetical protein [Peptostreptococcaceae bacterium]MBP3929109.1 hypothetical protein [Peptostreptococcaceae bacterium]
MIDIKDKVCDVLEEIGVPYGFVSKDEGDQQFIVYNINSEKAFKYFEDEEGITQYKITLNIFSVYDYTELKNKIDKKMKEHGFKKDYYPACIYIENMRIYNQPMYFNYYEEGDY